METQFFEQENGQIGLFGEDLTTPLPCLDGFALDAEQCAAAKMDAEKILLMGDAGTGKTCTLAERIAYLIDTRGVSPAHILVITSSKGSAQTLRERLADSFGGRRLPRSLSIGTIQSIVLARRAARGQETSCLSEQERMHFARQAARESGFEGTPEQFLQKITALKAGIPEENVGLHEEQMAFYQWYVHAAGVADADDFLLDEIDFSLEKKQNHYHVLVDDFQDIDGLSYRLTEIWSQHGSFFAAGDPNRVVPRIDRCFDPFLQKKKQTPEMHPIYLRKSYACAPLALYCAKQIVEQKNPVLPSDGEKVRCVTMDDVGSEASFLAQELAEQRLPSPAAVQTIGIICRTERQYARIARTLKTSGLLPGEGITLCTAEQLEGRFFDSVYLCGMTRGLWPLQGASEEGERALLYYAMTRARRQLILIAPGMPSPFLSLLPQCALLEEYPRGKRGTAPGEQLALF